MSNAETLFFRNASQLLTLAGPPVPRRGRALGELGIIPNGGVLIQRESIVSAVRAWRKPNEPPPPAA